MLTIAAKAHANVRSVLAPWNERPFVRHGPYASIAKTQKRTMNHVALRRETASSEPIGLIAGCRKSLTNVPF
jgi:hypothetical protein